MVFTGPLLIVYPYNRLILGKLVFDGVVLVLAKLWFEVVLSSGEIVSLWFL